MRRAHLHAELQASRAADVLIFTDRKDFEAAKIVRYGVPARV
jgi:hypothetical protein